MNIDSKELLEGLERDRGVYHDQSTYYRGAEDALSRLAAFIKGKKEKAANPPKKEEETPPDDTEACNHEAACGDGGEREAPQ